jgi:hypothetical protein
MPNEVIPSQVFLEQNNATIGRNIARLILLLNNWQRKAVDLRGKNDKETKANINQWLNDFEQIYTNNIYDITVLYGIQGHTGVNMEVDSQGGVTRTQASAATFTSIYQQRAEQMRGKILTEARALRNYLAKNWIGKANQFYTSFDEFTKEANALGIPLRDQVTKFLSLPLNKDFTYTPEKGRRTGIKTKGGLWRPDAYGSMYARTRGREIEDIVRLDETRELGLNIVQVSNANTTTPICLKYEGKYFWIDAPVEGLQRLPIRPPFHPNCVHRILPIVRDQQAKFISTNQQKDSKFNRESKKFTPGQNRSVNKQEQWNLANRIQV